MHVSLSRKASWSHPTSTFTLFSPFHTSIPNPNPKTKRLSILWRDWMTGRTMNLYYSNRVYYTLERGREIDNPDQRIAEDVRTFTNQSLNLFLNIVTSTIDLVSFSIILATIRAQLFIAIFGYATVGMYFYLLRTLRTLKIQCLIFTNSTRSTHSQNSMP